MEIKGVDPQSSPSNMAAGAAGVNANTGLASVGGVLPVRVIDIGDGTGALAMIAVTRSLTSVNAATSSTQLLAADPTRVAAAIVNNGTTIMYLAFNGATATTSSTFAVNPGAAQTIPGDCVAGKISAIWAGSPSGAAAINALTV